MRTLCLSLLFVVLCSAASAQNRPRPRSLAPEWTSLFNGKDLSGWNQVGHEKWVVEDGVIYGEGVTKEFGYLTTDKTYRDFQLRLSFKCEADGNSGVYIHADFEPGTATIIAGRQVEIDRKPNFHTGGIYGDGVGWLAWPRPETETVLRPNDWNDMLIEVEGNHYQVRLNGIQVLDFTHPSPVAEEGVIALQLHSGGQGRMRFRDIFIRDLRR